MLKILVLCSILFVIALAAALHFFDPVKIKIFPDCMFHRITGLYCPGCGATRAFHALLNGRLLDAARFNIFVLVVSPFLAYSLGKWSLSILTGRTFPVYFLKPLAIWSIVVLIILFWIFRNIPFYPFSLLAPHAG